MLSRQRLHQVLWAFIVAFAALALINLVRGIHLSAGLELATVALLLVADGFNRRERPLVAAWLTLSVMTLALISLMAAGQGLYDEAPIAFPGILVFASMFGSRRLFFTLLALMLGSLAAMYGLHVSGLLPSRPQPIDLARPIVLALAFSVTGAFIGMVAADLRRLMLQLEEEKKALEHSHARITTLAYEDSLTQLPNRALAKDRLQQMLAQAARERALVAILYLDLDNFKTINDSLGHAAGDELLRQVGQRLKTVLRPTDTVARLSGDEFLLLLADVPDEETITAIAAKLMEQLTPAFTLEGLDVHITASLGITVSPRDGVHLDALLKNADLAMYQAKDAGRNTFRFFDPAMNASVLEHLHLATGLRHALSHGGLQLHYQPQWNLKNGRIIGAEALLRWQHPELGWIEPAKFIPIAERAGLIHELGAWVLHQACTDLQRWRSEGITELTIAINVSPLQFRRSDMAHEVASAIAAHALPARMLELEITESTLVADAQHLEETLRRLHQLGVQIAIDDFGTGYSNLGYLQRYPVQRLKIDQSFVRRLCRSPQDEGLVRAIIEMAHCLGLHTLAEGVEDAATLQRLQAFGCEFGQGFHWSPAIPAQDFTALVRAQT